MGKKQKKKESSSEEEEESDYDQYTAADLKNEKRLKPLLEKSSVYCKTQREKINLKL